MFENTYKSFSITLLVAVIFFTSCSQEQQMAPSPNGSDFQQAALEFVNSLAQRNYSKAYAMTGQEYRSRTTTEQLQAAFETIVPMDWGTIGPIEVGQTMTTWPGRRLADLGWVYVSVGGDVYSEAVIVVVMSESGEAKIREIEFGRP